MVDREFILKCYLATRPWSLPASLVPVFLGNILAWKESPGSFDVWLSFFSVICVVCVHLAGNLMNSYYDYVNGVDTVESDDTTLVAGTLHPHQVFNLGQLCYLLSSVFLVCVLLLTDNEWFVVAVLFTAGAGLSFVYTGGLSLKYFALGDLIIALTFGPIAVLFGFTVHKHCVLALKPICLSLPLVCLTEAILHINNCRDYEGDKKRNISTLAIFLGKELALKLFRGLIFMPFICTGFMVLLMSKSFVITILSLPQMLAIARQSRNGELKFLPQETAKLNLVYGVLYLGAVAYSLN